MPKKRLPRRTSLVALPSFPSDPPAAPPRPATDLFARIADILDQARGNVIRAVNVQIVSAYWLIGREIVQELQGGKDRAAYGKQVLADLSLKLTGRYGTGFSETNLKDIRRFYSAYPIRHPLGDELPLPGPTPTIPRSAGAPSSPRCAVPDIGPRFASSSAGPPPRLTCGRLSWIRAHATSISAVTASGPASRSKVPQGRAALASAPALAGLFA